MYAQALHYNGNMSNGIKFFYQKLQSNKAVSRKELLTILTTLPRCKVVMKSCGGAHYWVRHISRQSDKINEGYCAIGGSI